jgi:hypothetical protein
MNTIEEVINDLNYRKWDKTESVIFRVNQPYGFYVCEAKLIGGRYFLTRARLIGGRA